MPALLAQNFALICLLALPAAIKDPSWPQVWALSLEVSCLYLFFCELHYGSGLKIQVLSEIGQIGP